jgi:subtilisin-like proprotein convertase family protein
MSMRSSLAAGVAFSMILGLGAMGGCSDDAPPAGPDAATSETVCDDGVDDDADGQIDCADSDCGNVLLCIEAACDNGVDDDGDTHADCADPDCDGVPPCELGTELTCTDGEDNDADGQLDCADVDCDGVEGCEHGAEASCADHFDNDGDGERDCDDEDCTGDFACIPETDCGDGLDNDSDGDTDCEDVECDGDPYCQPESECGDGIDDDHDTLIDCADPDCQGVDGCYAGPELLCFDGIDNEADGIIDCEDTDCAPACAVTFCPAGSTPFVARPTTLPLTIPSPGLVNASIGGQGFGLVADLRIGVTVTHPADADLRMYLLGPDNTTIELTSDNGGSGANYTGTVFNDSAGQAITAGTAPFTGDYRPEQPLGTFTSHDISGPWRLTVQDDTASNGGGALTDYVFTACVCSGADCEQGAVACTDGIDNDGDALIDCADPSCGGYAECVPEPICNDRLDNDLDGLADCADPDCAGTPECVVEANCGDGLDDDGDGDIDCFDAGCFGSTICPAGPEPFCGDGIDNDGDGSLDCGDTDCGVACSLACEVGTQVILVGPGLPKPIIGNTVTTVSYDGGGVVTHAAVEVSLLQSYNPTINIRLEAPNGSLVELSTGNDGSHYTDTVFIDEASTSIIDGAFPYTGAFRPEGPLSVVDGRNPYGNWTLHVDDQYSYNDGTLNEYKLYLCVCDCADPACADFAACVPEPNCGDHLDDDLDSLIDCLDPDCDGVSGCELGHELSCGDAFDNDGDGRTDCADSLDCIGSTECVPETSCNDGIDNDEDGHVDCADPGCPCQPGGETSCSDGFDNDFDGAADCADTGCLCHSLTCTGTQVPYEVKATDLPLAISDNTTIHSSINIDAIGTLQSAAVRFSATHTYTGDLDLSLRAPSGSTVDLCSDNGGGGDNFNGTIFVDSASTLITAGTPPYAGSFRPEQPLSSLNTQAVTGLWQLILADDAGGDIGSFTDFTLAMCVQPAP